MVRFYHTRNVMSILAGAHFFDFFYFFSKKLLTSEPNCVTITKLSRKTANLISMERWLSWSKAHDWKSCFG